MEAFTLDTSGVVQFRDSHGELMTLGWNDLSPFAQGYIEALFATPHPRSATGTPMGEILSAKFSDLAPETLARIIADCARYREADRGPIYGENHKLVGRAFWATRQSQMGLPDFPPLLATLADDGKIYLAEAV
jgi:hypothetical protein